MTDKIGNGSMPLRIGNLINTNVFGGPYKQKVLYPQMFGVKMAVEIGARCDVAVDTSDFDVPKVSELRVGVIRALMAIINGKFVYVGCMGGIGRTGLFLAALAKVQIEYRKTKHREGRGEDPVLYVRKHFIPNALETQEQINYISNFDVTDIVTWLNATQVAMGLGGMTPAKDGFTKITDFRTLEVGDEVVTRTDGDTETHFVRKGDVHDNFKADWKENYRGQVSQAYDSANPDDLQTQIFKLEERLSTSLDLEGMANERIVSLEKRMDLAEGNALYKAELAVKAILRESGLTKQTWREKISQYFERIANYHF